MDINYGFWQSGMYRAGIHRPPSKTSLKVHFLSPSSLSSRVCVTMCVCDSVCVTVTCLGFLGANPSCHWVHTDFSFFGSLTFPTWMVDKYQSVAKCILRMRVLINPPDPLGEELYLFPSYWEEVHIQKEIWICQMSLFLNKQDQIKVWASVSCHMCRLTTGFSPTLGLKEQPRGYLWINKCLGHKLGLVPWLAHDLWTILIFTCP